MIRAFVALPVPDEVRARLAAVQSGLSLGRLVPPENFHVTLAFLDRQPGSLMEDLHAGLSTIQQAGIDLSIDRLDVFGSSEPRSLFAGLATNNDLTSLRKKVRQTARAVGIDLPAEKFVPHVTLARFKKTITPDEADAVHTFISRRNLDSRAQFRAEAFVLYRSHLRHEAPIYEPLETYVLSTPG